ncbi:hypothetical protein [Sinimarinibacterium flocculans]|uniref:hypothetical protein n=1 Tax=Sinimarinibacterium flocculans TaxID=985250 RepID=UPI00248FDE59|nr:hypothetical protein [Sinimarinibacterium flocculans]
MNPHAVEYPARLRDAFGTRTVTGLHRLADNPLFGDAALTELLDRMPRERLYAFSTGTDPERVEDNRLAVHVGVSGAQLLQAVRRGRLWLNATRVDLADPRYRDLIRELYVELAAQIPGFVPESSQGTLLISSPRALVYYHADGPASVLWHVRGRKRVWVYPALHAGYMQRELLEDIFAGVRHEYLPYARDYDDGAQIFDLAPGQWIAWPQNAPHRVTNLDGVNVSLSTEYFTAASRRRFQIYVANRFLRTRLGLSGLSAREDGAMAVAKTLLQRSARRLGLNPLSFRQHAPVLRVAADAPAGVLPLTAGDAGAAHD